MFLGVVDWFIVCFWKVDVLLNFIVGYVSGGIRHMTPMQISNPTAITEVISRIDNISSMAASLRCGSALNDDTAAVQTNLGSYLCIHFMPSGGGAAGSAEQAYHEPL